MNVLQLMLHFKRKLNFIQYSSFFYENVLEKALKESSSL